MNCVVRRRWFSGNSVIGNFWMNGKFFCFTLEPSQPIPLGTYDLTIRWSEKFQRLVPHVENVPGHSGIEVHWGNWPKDTEGCTLLGLHYDGSIPDYIGNSRIAFDDFFSQLQSEPGPHTISYITDEVIKTS